MTFDAGLTSRDKIDNLSREVLQNRERSLKNEILSGTGIPSDNSRLLVDFLTDSDGFQNSFTTTGNLFFSGGGQFENYHLPELNTNLTQRSISVSTGTNAADAAYDKQTGEVALLTNTNVVDNRGNSGTDNKIEVTITTFNPDGTQKNTITSTQRDGSDFNGRSKGIFYTSPRHPVVFFGVEDRDNESTAYLFGFDTEGTGTAKGSARTFIRNSNVNDLYTVSYQSNGGNLSFGSGEDASTVNEDGNGNVSVSSTFIFNSSPDDIIQGIDDGTAFHASFAFDDTDRLGAAAKAEDYSFTNFDDGGNSGSSGTRISSGGDAYEASASAARGIRYDINSNNFDNISDVSAGFGSPNFVVHNSSKGFARTDTGTTIIDFARSNGGANVGEGNPLNSSPTVTLDGDAHVVSGTNPVNVSVLKGKDRFEGTTTSVVDTSGTISPQDLEFADNGNKLYVLGGDDTTIVEYDLSTSYDITTRTFAGSKDFSSDVSGGKGFAIENATDLYFADTNNDDLVQFELTTDYDITSANQVATKSLTNPTLFSDMTFSSNQDTMIALTDSTLYEYSFGTNGDITTISFEREENINVSQNNYVSVSFTGLENRLLVMDRTKNGLREYRLAGNKTLAEGIYLDRVFTPPRNSSFVYSHDNSQETELAVFADEFNDELVEFNLSDNILQASGFQQDIGPITNDSDFEQIRVEFDTNTGDSIPQVKIVDNSTNSVVDTIDTGRDVSISGLGLNDISLRLTADEIPTGVGAEDVKVVAV